LIKSEDLFLIGIVLLTSSIGFAEVDVVESAQALFKEKSRKLGELVAT